MKGSEEEAYSDMEEQAWIYCNKYGQKIYPETRFYPERDNLAVIAQKFYTRFALKHKLRRKRRKNEASSIR